jgi:uncharacterized membrane protein
VSPGLPQFDPAAKEDIPPAMTQLVSLTLRVGVGLAALLALAGLALLLAGPSATFTAASVHGAPFSGAGFVSGLAHGHATDVLFLAFVVLILTPLFRVIISVGLFAQVRDRPFTALTVTVLLLLGVSVLIGAVA